VLLLVVGACGSAVVMVPMVSVEFGWCAQTKKPGGMSTAGRLAF